MQALEMEVEDPEEEYSYEYEETDGFLRSSDPSPSPSPMVDFQKTYKDVTAFFKKHRRISTLMLLAVFVTLFLFQADGAVTTEFEKVDYTVEKVHGANGHGNSFGGINNIAHPGGAKAAANNEGVAFADIIIPESNVGHAVKSLNEANIKNLWGHYVHDEHRSPYASFRYASKTKEELEEEQESYVRKMKRVREEWGAWDFADPNPNLRAKTKNQADFTKTPYKDLPVSEFPSKAWQADKDYLELFLKEGRALVTRMQKGIYAEYGWPLKDGMSTEELENHEGLWKIHVLEDNEDPNSFTTGIAKLSKVAMDGLVRKLLHAMTTHDEFYAILAGHSAAAGHGNNFQQNRIITFHKIMEPVFDKLGMRLVSRNMAMGGVGTLQFSMAGGDLYGEADILEWDSGMTEKGPAVDLFNKQAILSGERVPVIMSDYHFDIMTETKGTAYFGQYINDNSIFPLTDYSNVDTIPYAAQWFHEKEDKYNAVCWEPRDDYTPTVQQKQKPRGQASWHPGNRRHLWSGRKLALIVLHALSLAFDTWERGLEKDGYPLAEQYWHVQKKYDTIRQNLRTHITTPKEGKEDIRSHCEHLISWLPRICRVQLHGFGMWNPRANDDFDFLNLIHEAPNGYKPYYKTEPVYSGFDLLPYVQKLADDQVDVHAIAIATTSPPPPLNHSYSEDDDHNGETEETPPTRRWLRLNSDKAIRHADRSRSNKPRSIVTPRKFSRRKLVETNADNEIIAGRGWEVRWIIFILVYCLVFSMLHILTPIYRCRT